jgi:hypothetical protein
LANAGRSTARGDAGERQSVATETATQAGRPTWGTPVGVGRGAALVDDVDGRGVGLGAAVVGRVEVAGVLVVAVDVVGDVDAVVGALVVDAPVVDEEPLVDPGAVLDGPGVGAVPAQAASRSAVTSERAQAVGRLMP